MELHEGAQTEKPWADSDYAIPPLFDFHSAKTEKLAWLCAFDAGIVCSEKDSEKT